MDRKGGKPTISSRDFAALLLLVASVLWFNDEMVWGDKVPFFRDLGPVFYPMRFSLAESFQQGEIPLWDRHVAMGFPLLANFQSGVFYPPHLVFLFLPFFVAIRALFVFHYLVAAAGAYSLCRRWGYPTSLALIGAILFAFGGYTVSLSNMLSYFQTAVWLPWALLLGERVLRSQSMRDFILFVFVLLVQLLAGAPEIYGMTQGLLILDGLRFRAEETRLSTWRLMFLFVAANVLVVGLAMVQLLPTVELFTESRGHHTISFQHSVRWSFHPVQLLNLFFLDKEVDLGVTDGVNLFLAQKVALMISLYMGAIALPGICLWLVQGSARGRAALLGLFITVLLVAMGDQTPVYPFLFQHMPVIGLIRYPEKLFFLNYNLLLFVILRGLFFSLRRERFFSARSLLGLAAVWVLFFSLYIFSRFDSVPLTRLIAKTTDTAVLSAATLDRASLVLVHLERQVMLTSGILLLLLLLRNRGESSTSIADALLVALVFIDLSSAHRPYHFPLNPDSVYKSQRIIPAPDREPHRLFYYPGGYDDQPGTKQPTFAEFQSLLVSILFPNTGLFQGFDYLQDLDSLATRSYVLFGQVADKLPPERQHRLFGVLNVKYLISPKPLPEEGITLFRHFPENSTWLYRVDRVIPRTYIVPRFRVETDPIRVINELSQAGFDPLKEVILEQPLSIPAKKDFYSQADIVSYTNQLVSIRATLNNPGVLVLADSFYPGWRVYVNGSESKILRANFFFRGVLLPEGEHLLEFRYHPLSFTIGLAISLMTFFGALIALVASFLRH